MNQYFSKKMFSIQIVLLFIFFNFIFFLISLFFKYYIASLLFILCLIILFKRLSHILFDEAIIHSILEGGGGEVYIYKLEKFWGKKFITLSINRLVKRGIIEKVSKSKIKLINRNYNFSVPAFKYSKKRKFKENHKK